ncbi:MULTISPECIES: branched-chain amino acid ABC transporter permease [unclassified Aeromicrobium]|uniref:branched-chain amino acid ABC transporter permease n=1 Tax=unclassified Aeromicrobium TaxID=2633570 RepID=UPI00396B1EEC
MSLFIGTLIAGIALGLLYGLLGFSIVVLHKATGVANFAQGALAMLASFLVVKLGDGFSLSLGVSIVLTAVLMVFIGSAIYALVLRPMDDAGTLNITIRTFGVLMLITAVVNIFWSEGQPFSFPSVFPDGVALNIGQVAISWLTVGTIIVAGILVAACGVVFNRTRLGLTFLALAERPEIARLLGVKTRRLSLIAWAFASLVAVVVGVLVAPSILVSSNMMDGFLLFSFAAAVVGGLDSLGGAFVGGLIVGAVSSVSSVYASHEMAAVLIFALVLVSLVVRPQGIFGRAALERL